MGLKKVFESFKRLTGKEPVIVKESLTSSVEQIIDEYDLDNRINSFYTWLENEYCGKKIIDLHEIKKLVWKFVNFYELRYPNYFINKGLKDPYDYNKLFTDQMEASKDCFTSVTPELFFKVLSEKEKRYFDVRYEPNFKVAIGSDDYYSDRLCMSLTISKKGNITARNIHENEGVDDRRILRNNPTQTVKDLYEVLLEYVEESDLIELKNVITAYEHDLELKSRLLDTITYAILRTSNWTVAPTRALKFVLEIGGDIRIPYIYGIDTSSQDLISIEEGLENGLPLDTLCIDNYCFSNSPYEFITVRQYLEQYNPELLPNNGYGMKQLVDLFNINISQRRNDKQAATALIHKYIKTNLIGLRDIYDFNLLCYQELDDEYERPSFDMLMWMYLMKQKDSLIPCYSFVPDFRGEGFYSLNKDIVHKAAIAICSDFEISEKDLLRSTYSEVNKPTMHNEMFEIFKQGITKAASSLECTDENDIIAEMVEFSKQDYPYEPILTEQVQVDIKRMKQKIV